VDGKLLFSEPAAEWQGQHMPDVETPLALKFAEADGHTLLSGGGFPEIGSEE